MQYNITWQCSTSWSLFCCSFNNTSFLLHTRSTMENLYVDAYSPSEAPSCPTTHAHYQPASRTLLLAHPAALSLRTHPPHSPLLTPTHHFTLPELAHPPLLLDWLVDQQLVLVVSPDGTIFTVDLEGRVDVKAMNEDGLAAASLSPTQDYLYLVSSNATLIQLNREYDLVNEIPLDEEEAALPLNPRFSWRADGSFFVLNYQTATGRKAVTKDPMMGSFRSPAKSDPQGGLVQSVSERGTPALSALVAWQPSGSLIAGTDVQEVKGEKIHRVVFWQKNGLRHLEFTLPAEVQKVNDLFWSLDSAILFVKSQFPTGEKLLCYYRANYHWFLKHTLPLRDNSFCLPMGSSHRRQRLLIADQSALEVLEYSVRLDEKDWKSEDEERQRKEELHYFVDGKVLHVTDFSKCLMPPPMSMYQQVFSANIVGVAKRENSILVVTEEEVVLLNAATRQIQVTASVKALEDKRIYEVRLLNHAPALLAISGTTYNLPPFHPLQPYAPAPLTYSLPDPDTTHTFPLAFTNTTLTLGDNCLSDECSSFILYHEFLLFTVSCSGMYDKLVVVNLQLDEWVHREDSKVRQRFDEMEAKESLGVRLVERGSKIAAISEGRVVLQLPRGNLQAIYPKVITINQVRKKIASREYRCAFELIRTHKLDFNLMHDLAPAQFQEEVEILLKDLRRVDYINLLVAQTTDTLSTELQYAFSAKQLEERQREFELTGGDKINSICKLVSSTLRRMGRDEYILSIFTSDIKQGKINDVLFEIKELRASDVQQILPPHLTSDAPKRSKKLSSQEILEYVCWLVDANAIYDAALLTYDLELAAMTARCTQKDPKEYIPYLEALKAIPDPVDFRKKICLDLKRYEVAVKELSHGSPEQRAESLQLIRTHKLYKHGLIIYAGKQELRDVKEMIMEELLATGETNEAYRVCQSLGLHERALAIAKNSSDSQKIKECLRHIYPTQEQQVEAAKTLLGELKDESRNKSDLAGLFAFAGQYEEAVRIYMRAHDYKHAYKYLWQVSEAFREGELKEGFQLCWSIRRNDLVRDRKDFLEKYQRLLKVHKHKAEFGEPAVWRARENDDMYSEVSVSSRSQSNYTMSTTTGMRRKKDKKRSILSRKVKEGSPLEEQYLLAYIASLEEKVEDAVKDAKLLIQHLICLNLIAEAEQLRDELRLYIDTFAKYAVKPYARLKFEQSHPETRELYVEQRRINSLTVDSFNYLF